MLKKFLFESEKHLTFWRGHDRVGTILKSFDEDGQISRSFRELAAGASQCDAV